jgi:hypothetical protein
MSMPGAVLRERLLDGDVLIPDRVPRRSRAALLHSPAGAVGIIEEDERGPVSASPINRDTVVRVLDWADLHAVADAPLVEDGSTVRADDLADEEVPVT